MSPEARRQLQANDLRTVMATPQGRRLVNRIIEQLAGANAPSYTGDALSSAYREGQRSVGLTLSAEIQTATSELYLRMLLEAAADRQNERLEAEQRKPRED